MATKRTIVEVARRGRDGDYAGSADVAALDTRVDALEARPLSALGGITVAASDSPAWMKDAADFHPDSAGSDADHHQAAIDQSQTLTSGYASIPVMSYPGNYRWDHPIVLKSAAMITAHNGGGQRTAIVHWDGASNVAAMTKPFNNAYVGNQSFADLVGFEFVAGTAEPDIWLDLLDAFTGVDVFFNMQYVRFDRGRIQVRTGGWWNCQWNHLRFDTWQQSAIELHPDVGQSLSSFRVQDFTADNQGRGSTHPLMRSFCEVILREGYGGGIGHVTFDNARMEIHEAMLGVLVETTEFGGGDNPQGVDWALTNMSHQNSTRAGGTPILHRSGTAGYPTPRMTVMHYHGEGLTNLISGGWWSGTEIPVLPPNGQIPFMTLGGTVITNTPISTAAVDTANRPAAWQLPLLKKGSQIFDTTLNKPIWWDGTNWRDAAGTIV